MKLMHVFVASTAAFLILGSGVAKAGETINDVGAMACVVIYIAWLLLRMAWHLLCELWRRCRH